MNEYDPKVKEISVHFTMSQASRIAALVLGGVVCAAILTMGQTPTAAPIPRLVATTDNISGARESIRIDVLQWSTDAERDQMIAAWTLAPAPARGGRGAKKGDASDPFGTFGKAQTKAETDAAAAKLAPDPTVERVRGPAKPAAPKTPEVSLLEALDKASTVGHLWSPEVAGYAFRYAVRMPQPDGGERIILITDRRLGAWNDLWKPAGSDVANTYPFSVIELRLNAKGEGEGKISLTGKIVVDSAANTIALENYDALPVVLKNAKRQAAESISRK